MKIKNTSLEVFFVCSSRSFKPIRQTLRLTTWRKAAQKRFSWVYGTSNTIRLGSLEFLPPAHPSTDHYDGTIPFADLLHQCH